MHRLQELHHVKEVNIPKLAATIADRPADRHATKGVSSPIVDRRATQPGDRVELRFFEFSNGMAQGGIIDRCPHIRKLKEAKDWRDVARQSRSSP
jgi:hypothetical protein